MSNQKVNIYLEGISFENVETFKYVWATLKVDGLSDNELRICIATATSAMIRLNIIWTTIGTHVAIIVWQKRYYMEKLKALKPVLE